jgi:hypothetical protein
MIRAANNEAAAGLGFHASGFLVKAKVRAGFAQKAISYHFKKEDT